MINYVNGTLTHKSPILAVIEAAGIGWEIKIPVSTYEKLPHLGENCKLFTYLSFSQDGARIYGFASLAECELFKLLISVSGIGPKIAISIISTLSISSFVKAILSNEEGLLTRVPGLGKKSAQRLIIELRDKIPAVMEYLDPTEKLTADNSALEVETALLSLGFNIKDIRRELEIIALEETKRSIEELIKELIKRLYQKNK